MTSDPSSPSRDTGTAEVWTKHGNASLGVHITNGQRTEVLGTGLTTEEAVEAVCSYLPVEPVMASAEWLSVAEELAEALDRLITLKDGPRDAAYKAEKPNAWLKARMARHRFDSLTKENDG